MVDDRSESSQSRPRSRISQSRRREPAPPESMGQRVLVVEDEPSIAAGIVRGLRVAGYDVELANDGASAARAAARHRPALVVLDLMLPELSGYEFLERIRGEPAVPVIVVTARTSLEDRLKCFNLGATDYLPKPFWMEELLARVRLRLSPPGASPGRAISWDDVVVDLDAREVRVAGAPAGLTPQEFAILAYLVQRPGRAVSRSQLAELSDLNEDRDERTVDSHVARVRRKLGPASGRISTVWGIGYRFDRRDAEPGG
jgi:DNA-binding response OmpR family regulator